MLWCEFFLPFLFLFSYGGAFRILPAPSSPKCGYSSCAAVDPSKLNIHLVAHTHDDVGWLKTVDQYFFGSRSKTQVAGVQYILDSVVQALVANPERKFMYVETAFLWKWWVRQDMKTQQIVKNLINEGRLEIIGGGWSMNDEAVTHYHSLVDQYTWGFRRLYDTFGTCAKPHIGWQIDPFGHSREQASLFTQLGFDGLFLGRIDYQDKRQRIEDKSMEFIWKGSPNLGSNADLFTVVLYNTYSPPPGFCFDVLCRDDPINDDVESADYNVPEKVEKFLAYARTQASHYKTNNIILTMGEDFNYQQAEMWYTNMDRLIRYVRELNSTEVNIFYSTPSCYLKAVNDANLQWPTKEDDFFPYASDPHSYWTGYFSSRPTIKYFERMGNNLLQINKQLVVLANFTEHDVHLEHFREAMGIMQHHDAVTGTEKQLVADDYARILYKNMEQGTETVAAALKKWTFGNSNVTTTKMFSCMELNISSCPYTEEQNSILTIYNPLSFQIDTPIRVPVQQGTYKVEDLSDSAKKVVSQLVPIPNSVQQIPGRVSKATHELVFMAKVPALGYQSYKVIKTSDTYENIVTSTDSIQNELYEIYVNNDGKVVVNYKQEKDMSVVQSFHYYEGQVGNNEIPKNRSSGAYIFRPIGMFARGFMNPTDYKVYKGDVVQEIHQTVNSWISQVVRIYNQKRNEENVEFDWLVGPIPVEDKVGKEIVTKYSSNLSSKGEFFTDSNGREMLKRQRNIRPTWNLMLEEPVSGNYYPVTTKIALEDEDRYQRLSVITDRAQGGTSMKDGEIELMVHRRLLHDDAFGVGEALDETAFGHGLVARGSHYLLGGSTKDLDKLILNEKISTLKSVLRPWTLVTPFKDDSEITQFSYQTPVSGLNNSLPVNVHLLTLEPWIYDTVILRLEHIFEKDEAKTLSKSVNVNLQGLLANRRILTVREATLGANKWLQEVNRMQWKADSNEIVEQFEELPYNITQYNVTLNPMEIRTYIISFMPQE
ncbi:lysosomal alpha-mannosidase II isoform X1 [Megalopta genalis]|uniref:lysosomal alpha-mannosidase II isoform X1 n=1 Tax=Megalopta genalis TaxID=115081 RepID=UPI003FD43DD4